jgi:hypothetical protein
MTTAVSSFADVKERLHKATADAVSEYEQIVDSPSAFTADEIQASLQAAGKTIDDLESDLRLRRQRIESASDAAKLETLRAERADVEAKMQEARATHEKAMHDYADVLHTLDDDIKHAEHARRRLLRRLCPAWLRRALDDVHHRLGKARRAASEPAPLPNLSEREHLIGWRDGGEVQVGQDSPEAVRAFESWNDRALEHAGRIADAQAEVERLEAVAEALKLLALKATPTRHEMQAILDKHAEASEWL